MGKAFDKVLEMKNVGMRFGNIEALRNINFAVSNNEVVGLLGDNGAGKSTMVKIMTGVLHPTCGELYIRSQKVTAHEYTVKKAHSFGIETVYQDKSLGEKQALWRNFFIGRQITNRFGFINIQKEKEVADQILMDLIGFRGVGIGVDSRVSKLSGGERQGIAIGRAMYFDADLIVLDEPTVSLSVKEVRKVINFVEKIRDSGRSCVYISHNIGHVYDISDRFVIIDRGTIVANFQKEETTLEKLDTFLLKYSSKKREEE
ncbi:MAG: ATP-binding cassette domain-containing protein [Candidatus Atribacteria bacterium]|nr:ATP-binding cassette domain-containing protein [Candidatus Atribacteria bacterium]